MQTPSMPQDALCKKSGVKTNIFQYLHFPMEHFTILGSQKPSIKVLARHDNRETADF